MNTLLINVLIILALGAVFILASWYISRKISTADQYISGRGKLGVAFGTTSLLAFWITGNTIMAAPEAAFTYGVTGAIGYSFYGGAAVIAFATLARRIHEVIPKGRTIGDFIKNRFDKKTYIFFLVMLFVYVMGMLVTQGIGGGVLLEQVFDIPYWLAITLTFSIVIVYATMGGFASVTGLAFFQVMLIFIVVIVVPPIVYFSTGITPVHEGMLNFDPSKLDLLLPAGLLYMFGGLMMAAGEVFMDNTFWQRAYAVDKKKIMRIFTLAGIGWFFVPLSVSSIAFVAIATQQMPDHVNQLVPYIAAIYGGNFTSWVFLVGVWSALASTIAAVLNALVALVLNDVIKPFTPKMDAKKGLEIGRYLTVGIGLLGLLLSIPKVLTMLELLIFLGVINAAFLFPIIYGLFWKKLRATTSFWAAVLATAGGYIVYFEVGSLEGVVASAWISFLFCWIGSLVYPGNFDWSILRRVGEKTK